MGDPELETLRQQRLAQLQSQYTGEDGSNQVQAEQQQKQMEEMRHSILTQVLNQSARARLNTLSLGKPEKAKMVEEMLVNLAQRGQLPRKLDEADLIQLLQSVNQQSQKTTVKFDRRRAALDSDDDL